jgi:hypothetical protein
MWNVAGFLYPLYVSGYVRCVEVKTVMKSTYSYFSKTSTFLTRNGLK